MLDPHIQSGAIVGMGLTPGLGLQRSNPSIKNPDERKSALDFNSRSVCSISPAKI
jgi:hypothetical protein